MTLVQVRRRAAALALMALSGLAAAQPIQRSAAEVRAFRAENPCPATGRTRGACPGHVVDHVRPLCAGGEDRPANMQWISAEDHRFKTLVDVRECRKLRRLAESPARYRFAAPHHRNPRELGEIAAEEVLADELK